MGRGEKGPRELSHWTRKTREDVHWLVGQPRTGRSVTQLLRLRTRDLFPGYFACAVRVYTNHRRAFFQTKHPRNLVQLALLLDRRPVRHDLASDLRSRWRPLLARAILGREYDLRNDVVNPSVYISLRRGEDDTYSP